MERDHPEWRDPQSNHTEAPIPVSDATRHGLIISSTFPAFLVMAIFFALRWLLINGERAASFRDTAIGFAAVGVILGAINIAIRRRLDNKPQQL